MPREDAQQRRGGYRAIVDGHSWQPLALRLRQWHWVVIDVLIAALCAAVLFTATHWDRPASGMPSWGAATIVVLATAPIVMRRYWPVTVLGIILVAGTIGSATGNVAEPLSWFTEALALYTAGFRISGKRSVFIPAVAVAAVFADTTLYLITAHGRGSIFNATTIGEATQSCLAGVVIVCGAWLTGVAARQQRVYDASLRAQTTHRAIVDERLRIARELHDIVSHSISVITVEAEVARYVADTEPAQAHRALASIASTGQNTLRELRHLLGALRTEPADPVALSPVPGVANLPTLINDVERAGVGVELRILGEATPLPPGIDLSVYRIVQEGLTNVVKHAVPAQATITLDYQPHEIGIKITDDGQHPSTNSAVGHGLIGMRERVDLYGGTFSAEALPGRGFHVHARIPLESDGS